MSMSILVTFASSYGSTQEVAEVVAATLCEQGAEVDLRPVREVRTLDKYNAVVLGAPMYMFRWHKDAHHFLTRFQRDLTHGLPIAVFAGGPIEDTSEQWRDRRRDLDQELAKFPWLKPVSVQLIGGKFDPATLRLPYSLLPALRKMPACDLRDWPAIRAWAGSLVEKFQPVVSACGRSG
jgi:menaquinone-dependent protoporphyrinogen oxidase